MEGAVLLLVVWGHTSPSLYLWGCLLPFSFPLSLVPSFPLSPPTVLGLKRVWQVLPQSISAPPAPLVDILPCPALALRQLSLWKVLGADERGR